MRSQNMAETSCRMQVEHALLTPRSRCVCARQLKSVRKQFNEYRATNRTMLHVTITLASYVVFLFLVDDFVLRRRIGIVCESYFCSFHRKGLQ